MGNNETKGTIQGNGQKQLQISKQKQVQDQAYSYGTMGNFFSAMEWYANKSALEKKKKGLKTIKFEHYDNFECGKKKTLSELRMQIITQFEIFKVSYFVYINDYGQYDFPESLPRETIISLIKKWKNYVDKKDYILYDSVLKVLDGDKTVSLLEILEKEVEKNGGNGKEMNPKDLIDMTKIAGKSQQMGKKINENFNKDPNYKPDMILNQEEVGNKDIQKVGKEYDERKQLEDNIKEKINKIILFLEGKLGIKDSKFFNSKEEEQTKTENINEKKETNNDMIDKKEDNKEEEKNHNEKETNNNMIDKKEDNKEEEKNHNEKKTNNEIKLENEIKKLSQIMNKYQNKFNDYYYNNTADGFDRLIEYCRDTLKKEAVEKNNTELSSQIDNFIKFLKKNKPDSES